MATLRISLSRSSALVFSRSASTSESRLSPPLNVPYKILKGKSIVSFCCRHQPEELKSETERNKTGRRKTEKRSKLCAASKIPEKAAVSDTLLKLNN
jgi:hypothetical protein